MAEQSKFSGALARLNQPKPNPQGNSQGPVPQGLAQQAMAQESISQANESQNEAPHEAPQETPSSNQATLTTVERARGGRPAGKRSDPDFQQTTLLLRKATKKKAVRQLEDSGAKTDLSELVEQLLTDWTTRQV